MSDDTPDTDQYFALVDELEHLIESASDEPHFSAREHALMGAGVITRGWLAADRRAVAAKALRDAAGQLHGLQEAHAAWADRNPKAQHKADALRDAINHLTLIADATEQAGGAS